ncbi:hypothetical protein DD235_03315 [Corticimicrobacter populi]|uniref:Cell division protein ZipA n=2 Tax=Corticimicrobacter populi TaxID=2175229 RepID=A0A2V1K1Q2_9BURK|nr:hypothetical protein DD235_03315 [Corticimicrobacter populi]
MEMSDLQIGLIVLGLLFVAGVLAFNWWQDRRARARMQVPFPEGGTDPLMAEEASARPATAKEAGRREPGLHEDEAAAPRAREERKEESDEPDPTCEVVIELHFPEPVVGKELALELERLKEASNKSYRIFARTFDQAHRVGLRGHESYGLVQVAVLMVNRNGPLTDIEWSQIWLCLQEIAEKFDATMDGPDQKKVVEKAASLDETCAALDMQLGVAIVLEPPKKSQDVMFVARSCGFVQTGNVLHLPTRGRKPPHVTLVIQGLDNPAKSDVQISRLDMLLDVPRSEPQERPFGKMLETAVRLAQKLEAQLVDDQGRPIEPGCEEAIDQQVRELYQKMQALGLPAGHPRTLRVFS